MKSKQKLNKAIEYLESILEEGDLETEQNDAIEDALRLLEDIK